MKTQILKSFVAAAFLLTATYVRAGSQEDLLKGCQSGDLEAVKKSITEGAQVNTLDAGGNPALTYAVFYPDIVKYLLDNKADPNLGTNTVLNQALFYSSLDVLQLILDAGADPNKPTVTDPAVAIRSAMASEKAKGKQANKYMIKAYEDQLKNAKVIENYPVQTLVTNTNCVACLQLMIAKGAKTDKATAEGTLLHTFAAGGASREYRKTTFAAIKTSIEPYGYKVPEWYSNMSDERNGAPEDMLKVLLSKGLNINEKDKGINGIPPQTPFEVALGGGLGNKKEVLLALVSNGADVKVVSEWYGPAIFQASTIGFPEVVKAMVEKGAEINAEGAFFAQTEGALLKGYTPITIAAYKDHLDLVKYLIGAGAKTGEGVEGKFFNSKTKCLTKVTDKTAIYYAIENGNLDMVKFLVESGGKWDKRLNLDQVKEKGLGVNDLGQQVYITTCFNDGAFTPSMYAKAAKMDEIFSYLKSKGL